MSTAPATRRPQLHSTWNATLRTALGAALAVTLVLLAFAWPTYTSRVRDTPVAVVGTPGQVAGLQQAVATHGDALALEPVADRAAAQRAIERREVYGAIVLPASPAAGTEVLTATAGSVAVSQLLVATSQQMAAQQARTVPAAGHVPAPVVTDVVPLSDHDPRGAGFAIAGLPLAMGGMIGGIMISTLVVGWRRRLAAIGAYGVLGGLGLALVLNAWFGFVPGNFAMIWLVTGLAVAATASFIAGAQSLVGKAGIALGAVVTMFIGNPISSLQSPLEWLPQPWGQVGQWFVPGAAGGLMRSEAYFPHAPTGHFWLALLAWLVAGIVMAVLGRHAGDEVVHIEGAVEPEKA